MPRVIKENKRIIFNGSNYSKACEKEAWRGLLKNPVNAPPQIVSREVIASFEKYKVLNELELHARNEIMLEQFNKTINVEGQLMIMSNLYNLPAAFDYKRGMASIVSTVKQAGANSVEGGKLLDKLTNTIDELKKRADKLDHMLPHEGNGSAEKHAKYFLDLVPRAMESLREAGDALEIMMPHEPWPLATYREMLYMRQAKLIRPWRFRSLSSRARRRPPSSFLFR